MSSTTATGNRQTTEWVRSNCSLVLMLPPPGAEPWAWHDLPERRDTPDPFPDGFIGKRSSFQYRGVVEKVGSEKVEHPNGSQGWRALWSVKRRAWDTAAKWFREAAKDGRIFPCGHLDGFTTIDADAEIYGCRMEFCEDTFDRETVERVMG